MFQFLYGAIGSSLDDAIHGLCDVSIPIWCDWKDTSTRSHAGRRWVSIPIWCDWKSWTFLRSFFWWRVSIPIWCDWKLTISQLTAFLTWFQFLYGAIGSPPAFGSQLRGFLFQFLYGAIGRIRVLFVVLLDQRFNSYMVRLEGPCHSHESDGWRVSIPIWCDWKRCGKTDPYPTKTFQFLYGAIGRSVLTSSVKSKVVSIPIWCDWKHYPNSFFAFQYRVSIPIWCDWKKGSLVTNRFYLFGFNSYMVRLEDQTQITLNCYISVSIPIWCDWKQLWVCSVFHPFRFNSYMVRLEAKILTLKSTFRLVSIPIWCDWKIKRKLR